MCRGHIIVWDVYLELASVPGLQKGDKQLCVDSDGTWERGGDVAAGTWLKETFLSMPQIRILRFPGSPWPSAAFQITKQMSLKDYNLYPRASCRPMSNTEVWRLLCMWASHLSRKKKNGWDLLRENMLFLLSAWCRRAEQQDCWHKEGNEARGLDALYKQG